MSNYISRDQLKKTIWRNFDMQDLYLPINFLVTIDAIPTADVVERRHGRWMKAYLDHDAFGVRPTVVYCSECNLVGHWETNYCPNCGADMRSEIEPDTSSKGESDG